MTMTTTMTMIIDYPKPNGGAGGPPPLPVFTAIEWPAARCKLCYKHNLRAVHDDNWDDDRCTVEREYLLVHDPVVVRSSCRRGGRTSTCPEIVLSVAENSHYGASPCGSRHSRFQKLPSQAVARRNMRRLGKL
jgi:hypothetical protein